MLTKWEMQKVIENSTDLKCVDYWPNRDQTEYLLWVIEEGNFMRDIHIRCDPEKGFYKVQLGWREEDLGDYYSDMKETVQPENVLRIITAFFNRKSKPINLEKLKKKTEKKEEYKTDINKGVEQFKLF